MDAINWHSFFFLLFALVACGFSVAVVATGNIVRMAVYLIMALGATAGLFFLAGAAFVGAMQLLIYVGGTLVLLIFGVMLTAQSPFISMKTRGGEWVLAAVVGGSLLALLLQAAFSVDEWSADKKQRLAQAVIGGKHQPDGQIIIEAVEQEDVEQEDVEHPSLLGYEVVIEPAKNAEARFAVASLNDEARQLVIGVGAEATANDVIQAVKKAGSAGRVTARRPAGTSGTKKVEHGYSYTFAVRAPRGDTPAPRLGLSLLGYGKDTGYLLPFEIISVHLLVILIAAAYLARTKKRANQTEQARN